MEDLDKLLYGRNDSLLQEIIDTMTPPDKPEPIQYEWDIMKDKEPKSDKHYQPTIDEWYVGFEYEQRREEWDREYIGIKVLQYIWEPVIGSLSSESGGLGQFMESIDPTRQNKHYRFTGGTLEHGAYSNMVRVKYLDRADIEELGFTCVETKDEYYFKFTQPSYNESDIIIEYYIWQTGSGDPEVIETHRLIDIYQTDGQPINYTPLDGPIEEHQVGKHLFRGYINNKSELKVLLKQLGIDE